LLLGELKMSPVEVLVHMGPPTGVILLAASAVWERASLLQAGGLVQALSGPNLCLLVAALVASVGVNATTMLAIKTTSSLTFKVVGCIKNSLVVVCGVL